MSEQNFKYFRDYLERVYYLIRDVQDWQPHIYEKFNKLFEFRNGLVDADLTKGFYISTDLVNLMYLDLYTLNDDTNKYGARIMPLSNGADTPLVSYLLIDFSIYEPVKDNADLLELLLKNVYPTMQGNMYRNVQEKPLYTEIDIREPESLVKLIYHLKLIGQLHGNRNNKQ